MSIIKYLLDIFFPAVCVGCRQESSWLCGTCFKGVRINKNFFAKGPQRYLNGVSAVSTYRDKCVRELIKILKYHGAKDVKETIERLVILFLKSFSQTLFERIDGIVPVPLHFRAKAKRGFNQAEILSRILNGYLGVPVINILKRKRNTNSQVGLSKQKRALNVKGAFTAANVPLPKSVLLVDDVLTTGATLSECARVLKDNGVEKVYGFVLAIEE